MEERNIRFNDNYTPILYQDGPLDVSPHDSFHLGKHFNSLTTHDLILPRPRELRTVRRPMTDETPRMCDHSPWMGRETHLQGRADHVLWEALKNRGTACNHGHLVMPDYIVPGYRGCLHRNPTYTGSVFKRCCPQANLDYDSVRHRKPYENQQWGEPCRQITPIVPGLKLCLGRREWM